MTEKQASKVRFVRCPKCKRVLPEPEHIPFYTCGGCSTILQVKNYKGPQKNTALTSHEQDVPKNGVIYACDDEKSSVSSQRSNSDSFWKSNKNEENGDAISFDNSSLSKESNFVKDEQNGEIVDIKFDKIFSKSEQNGVYNYSESTGLLKKSNYVKNEENGEINEECNGIVIGNLDQRQIGDLNSVREVISSVKSIEEEEDDDDNWKQKLARNVKSIEEKNNDDHDQKEKLVNDVKSIEEDNNKQKDVLRNENLHDLDEEEVENLAEEYENGSNLIEDTSALNGFPQLTHLGFENPRINDNLNIEVPNETSKMDVNVNEIEVEKSGNENGNGIDPNDVTEQLGNVHISSASDFKTSFQRGPTKVSREIPESSSKRSPAYDGSVSSFDGNNDKVEEERPQVIGSEGVEGSPEWNNLLLKRKIFGNEKAQKPPARSSSLMASNQKLKNKIIEEEGPLEGIGIPRKYRPKKENFLPRNPYQRRTSEITRIPEPPFSREEFHPRFYNSETSGELYGMPNNNYYIDRRRRTGSLSQIQTYRRIPYSGEMFIPRHRNRYMNRYPQNRTWSAQLPQAEFPGWETRWDPQRYVGPESFYRWGHDRVSFFDDQRYNDQIMRRMYLREKRQVVKRQFCPFVGGTPFITCYFCLQILQLPRDSNIFRKRGTHKLKCGACSRVLEFSLEKEGGLTFPCKTNHNRNGNLNIPTHSSSLNSVDGRVLISRDSFGGSNRGKGKLGIESSSNGGRMEGIPSRGRPPKGSWQISGRSKSPLHKLLGYSSANELLTFH